MLSLSNISPKQGETYYSRENYYTPEQTQTHSQWSGSGAAKLGLQGEIDRDEFSNLLQGKAPKGDRLPGRQIKPKSHRAGLDLTFSAPKSISIAALVGGDRRLETAHQIAVQRTLDHIEEHHAQARIWDGRKQYPTPTGNLIVAKFQHDTSRELDPQLHTHCVAINATQLPNGTWKALSNESIYRNAKLLGSIYKNELAHEVRQLGYEIEIDRDCLFELKGYTPEQLEHFSKRRQQIVAAVGEGANAKEREWATLRTRAAKGKDIPRELLHESWTEQAERAEIDLCHPAPTDNAAAANDIDRARDMVDRAVEHCGERSAVFRRTSLQQFVLDRIQPFDLATMEAAIASHPDLIATLDRRFTTETASDREKATLQQMQAGRDRLPAIAADGEELKSYLETENLTEGQRSAIHLAATTTDRFIAWQGVAGAGKTTALNRVKQLAETAGYRVEGYAPSASAAKVLGEELAIEASTVASLLLSPSKQVDPSQLWIVDEASLLNAKDAHALLNRAAQANARVILVGDVRQLSAVEAGHPFRSLQQAGMKTAHLEESLRQRTPDLKAAVDAVARGEVKAGLERLERFDRVTEISDEGDRRERMVQDYLSLSPEEREQTLLLAGTNAERQAIADLLRQELKGDDRLGEAVPIVRLNPKDLTEVQSRFAHHYEEGDVVIPIRHYNRRNLLRTEQYTVTAIAEDLLHLEGTDGSRHQVDPMSFRKRVYWQEAIELAVGDRLRRTRNDKEAGHRNGQECQVTAIGLSERTASLQYADGQTETIALSQKHHLDYNWVNTIHSSQGKTAKRALVMTDRAIGQESFYVAVSRVKEELKVYTSNRDRLLERVQTSQAQENPSEVVLRPTSESQTQERPASPRRSASRTTEPVAEQLQLGLDFPAPEPDLQPHPPKVEPRPAAARSGDRPIGTTAASDADRSQPQQSDSAGTVDRDRQPEYDARFAERIARHRRIREKRRDLARRIESSRAETGAVDPTAVTDFPAGERRAGERTETVQPSDSSPAQRQTGEPQDGDLDLAVHQPVEHLAQPVSDLSVRPPASGPVADLAENQRQGEQLGNQPAQDSGAGELEQTQHPGLKRMEQLSDEQLLNLEREVERWKRTGKRTAPERPSPLKKQELEAILNELRPQYEQLQQTEAEQQQELETLGPKRSFWYPFGSPAKEVEAAEARLSATQVAMEQLVDRGKPVVAELKEWERQEENYQSWATNRYIAPMLQAEEDIALPEVQARLEAIHTELERREQRQQDLSNLERWREVAGVLERSEAYLNRIVEVTSEVEGGQLLSEAAKQTMKEDFRAYREQLAQAPGMVEEVNRILRAVHQYLEHRGTEYANAAVYEGKRWKLVETETGIGVRSQRDGCLLLYLEGNKIERYQPLPQERQQLAQFCEAVEQSRELQRPKQRGYGPSL